MLCVVSEIVLSVARNPNYFLGYKWLKKCVLMFLNSTTASYNRNARRAVAMTQEVQHTLLLVQ